MKTFLSCTVDFPENFKCSFSQAVLFAQTCKSNEFNKHMF